MKQNTKYDRRKKTNKNVRASLVSRVKIPLDPLAHLGDRQLVIALVVVDETLHLDDAKYCF